MGIRGLGGCLDAVVQSPVLICLLSTFVDCGVGEVVDDESVEFFGGACPGLHGGTANRKHPYTSRTLANGQSVREDYGRFQQCKGGLREILQII